MNFDLIGWADAEGFNEPVDIPDKMKDLAFEYRNTSKHKMRVVRILNRPGAIDIQNEHSPRQARGDN